MNNPDEIIPTHDELKALWDTDHAPDPALLQGVLKRISEEMKKKDPYDSMAFDFQVSAEENTEIMVRFVQRALVDKGWKMYHGKVGAALGTGKSAIWRLG